VTWASLLILASSGKAASLEFQAEVAGDNPVLYYQFNEVTGVAINHGSLGVVYNADYFGAPQRGVATGAGDAGVKFGTAEDYLESDAVAPASLAGNPTFTAEAIFFVPNDAGASLWAPFLHWGVSTGSNDQKTMKSVYFSFSNNDATEVFAGFYNGGLQTVEPVVRDQWHHVVWVRQGGGAANVGSTVYVDGISVALENDPDLPADGGTPAVINTAFRVNRAQDFTRYFNGILDEVALYDRTLTAGEVEQHFRAFAGGGPTLSVERTLPGTVVVAWTKPAEGWRLEFATVLRAPPAVTSWTTVDPPYSSDATRYFITEGAPAGVKFYRLRRL
jgi:hypothetical protein